MREKRLYVVGLSGQKDGPVKIGVAKDVEKRVSQLQTSCPYPIAQITETDHPEMEAPLHTLLKPFRTSGEWFQSDCGTVLSAVDRIQSDGDFAKFIVEFAEADEQIRTLCISVANCENPSEFVKKVIRLPVDELKQVLRDTNDEYKRKRSRLRDEARIRSRKKVKAINSVRQQRKKPGPPKTKGKDPLRALRVPDDEWSAWKRGALEDGKSVSMWLRTMANRRIKQQSKQRLAD